MPPGVPTDAFALLDGWRGIAAWVLTGGAKRRDEWPRLPMSVGFPTDAKTALRQVSLYVTLLSLQAKSSQELLLASSEDAHIDFGRKTYFGAAVL